MNLYPVLISASAMLGGVVLALSGCYGDSRSDDLVSRKDVVEAFAAAGESVRLKLDMAKADPDSPIDALYQARGGAIEEGGFGVVVLEGHDLAARHAVSILAIGDGQIDVVRHKNIVLAVRSTMASVRRDRLVAVLESL
jgi:hypothetical protein